MKTVLGSSPGQHWFIAFQLRKCIADTVLPAACIIGLRPSNVNSRHITFNSDYTMRLDLKTIAVELEI